jgi:uncharacterized protein DUF397
VAYLDGWRVAVRDSKDPEGLVLEFTPGEWCAFLDGARGVESVRRRRPGDRKLPAECPLRPRDDVDLGEFLPAWLYHEGSLGSSTATKYTNHHRPARSM